MTDEEKKFFDDYEDIPRSIFWVLLAMVLGGFAMLYAIGKIYRLIMEAL
jgi:hypothetical protein